MLLPEALSDRSCVPQDPFNGTYIKTTPFPEDNEVTVQYLAFSRPASAASLLVLDSMGLFQPIETDRMSRTTYKRLERKTRVNVSAALPPVTLEARSTISTVVKALLVAIEQGDNVKKGVLPNVPWCSTYCILFAMSVPNTRHHADGFMDWCPPPKDGDGNHAIAENFGKLCKRLANFGHILAMCAHRDLPVALPILVTDSNLKSGGPGRNCLLSILVELASRQSCTVLQAAEDLVMRIQEGEEPDCHDLKQFLTMPYRSFSEQTVKFHHTTVILCFELCDLQPPKKGQLAEKVYANKNGMEVLLAQSNDADMAAVSDDGS